MAKVEGQKAVSVFPAWAHPTEKVLKELDVDVAVGLSVDEAQRRLKEYGHNELEKEAPTPVWKLLLEQFDDMVSRLPLQA